MPSLLELMGLLDQPTEMSIPQFDINSTVYRLQMQTNKYFTIPLDARANAAQGRLALEAPETEAQGDEEAEVAAQQSVVFNPTLPEHQQLIAQCTLAFTTNLTRLKAIDYKIMASVTLVVIASAFSFLPLVGYFTWLGLGSIIYQTHQRGAAYTDYKASLMLLVTVCHWSLGPGAARRTLLEDGASLTAQKEIRAMTAALFSVLTEAELRHLIANDLVTAFITECRQHDENFRAGYQAYIMFREANPDQTMALNRRNAAFHRCVYGPNKTAINFLDAFLELLPDLWKLSCHVFVKIQHKVQELTTPAQEHQA